MKTEQQIFKEVLSILDRLNIPYMIGGSVASISYGEPRMTLDMDVVVDLNTESAKRLINSFGEEYYADLDQALEAIRTSGFSRKRARAFDEESEAVFASPEDTILKKLEWHRQGGSQKHLDDIKGMLRISGDKIDLAYIDKWAVNIGVADIWQNLRGTI